MPRVYAELVIATLDVGAVTIRLDLANLVAGDLKIYGSRDKAYHEQGGNQGVHTHAHRSGVFEDLHEGQESGSGN